MDCLLYDLVSGIIIVKELNTNEESSINSVNVKSKDMLEEESVI